MPLPVPSATGLAKAGNGKSDARDVLRALDQGKVRRRHAGITNH